MKKLLVLLFAVALTFTLAACSAEEGDYVPGVYMGYTDGHQNTFAVVTIDENGFISQIFIDSVYMKSEAEGPVTWQGRNGAVTGIATTKRSLDGGCAYNMHPATPVVDCAVEGQMMWWQQVDAIAAAVIEAQEVPSFTIVDGKFDQDAADAVTGVTITVTMYITAIQNALNQAKK